MNAVEYFKSYGLSEAKRILRDARGCASVRLYDKYNFSTDDLKQIVDAFELIDRFGGLFSAKVSLNKEGYTGGIECGDDLIDDDQLKKAINLVEQCR